MSSKIGEAAGNDLTEALQAIGETTSGSLSAKRARLCAWLGALP